MGQCCRTISLHTTPGADATEPGSTTPGGETNNHPQEGSADPMPTPDEPQELEGDTLPDMKTSIGISASTANIVMNFDAGDQDIHRKGSTGVDVIDPTALQKVVMAATLGVDTDTDAVSFTFPYFLRFLTLCCSPKTILKITRCRYRYVLWSYFRA